MSTRLYLPSAGTGAISPAFDSSWEKTSTGALNIRPMLPWKQDSAQATVSDGTTGATGTFDVCVYQGISLKLSGSGTISGNIGGQIRCAEDNAAADLRIQWVLRVLDSTGSTVRGTLFGSDTAGLSHEFNVTTLRNITFPRGGAAAPTSVNYVAGDRIVLEIGYRKTAAVITNRIGSFAFGDVIGSSYLPVDETTTTADSAWIEFADTLTFQLEQSGIPNYIDSTSAAQTTAGTSLNISIPANQDGDLLLLAIDFGATASPSSTPSGYHYITHVVEANGRMWLYGKLASSDTPGGTVTISTGTAEYTAMLLSFRPSTGSWATFMEAILSVRLEAEASNTTPNVPEVPLPSTMSCTLLSFMSLGRGSTTTTPPTGYTMVENPDSGGTTAAQNESGAVYKYLASPGSASSTTWTVTNSGDTLCSHFVLVDPGVTARVVRNAKKPPELENGFLAATSIDIRVPAMVPGDLLVLLLDANGVVGFTTPSGWEFLTKDNIGGSGDEGTVYTRVSDGTEMDTTLTVSTVGASPEDLIGGILVISQADRIASYTSADDTTSDTSWVFPALTAAAQSPNSVEFGWYVATTGTSLLANRTDPSGYGFLWYSRAGNAGSNPCNCLASILRTTNNPPSWNFTGVSAVTGIGFHLSTATPYPTFNDAEVIV